MTIKEAIERFATYPDDTPCAFSLWLPDDVRTEAGLHDIELTDEEIVAVLDGFQRNAVNEERWLVMYYVIQRVIAERK